MNNFAAPVLTSIRSSILTSVLINETPRKARYSAPQSASLCLREEKAFSNPFSDPSESLFSDDQEQQRILALFFIEIS